eukprot:scaffold289947_cov51-Attheya_sp.AAC.2
MHHCHYVSHDGDCDCHGGWHQNNIRATVRPIWNRRLLLPLPPRGPDKKDTCPPHRVDVLPSWAVFVVVTVKIVWVRSGPTYVPGGGRAATVSAVKCLDDNGSVVLADADADAAAVVVVLERCRRKARVGDRLLLPGGDRADILNGMDYGLWSYLGSDRSEEMYDRLALLCSLDLRETQMIDAPRSSSVSVSQLSVDWNDVISYPTTGNK